MMEIRFMSLTVSPARSRLPTYFTATGGLIQSLFEATRTHDPASLIRCQDAPCFHREYPPNALHEGGHRGDGGARLDVRNSL